MKEGKKEKEKTIPSQDTMLSIPNYYRRNANQNNKKSNLPVRMTTLTSLQTVKGGEGQEERELPTRLVGRDTGNSH